jgi:DNA-binding response OmpR family regulator
MTTIRALIVDDERLARRRLRTLLADARDVEIVGECANGRDAVTMIGRLEPDLVFLDVQMPEMDGFGVLRTVGPSRMPPVIFVTAYDQYALDAFEVHALDYLLKPFDEKRLSTALRIARQRRAGEHSLDFSRRLAELLSEIPPDGEEEPTASAGAVVRERERRGESVGAAGLLARVRTLLRRPPPQPARSTREPIRFGEVEVRPAARTVVRSGQQVELRPKEFDLLLALAARPGVVLLRAELLREVWGYHSDVYSRTVDTHILELRRKLEPDPARPRHILTVRKSGYRFAP